MKITDGLCIESYKNFLIYFMNLSYVIFSTHVLNNLIVLLFSPNRLSTISLSVKSTGVNYILCNTVIRF